MKQLRCECVGRVQPPPTEQRHRLRSVPRKAVIHKVIHKVIHSNIHRPVHCPPDLPATPARVPMDDLGRGRATKQVELRTSVGQRQGQILGSRAGLEHPQQFSMRPVNASPSTSVDGGIQPQWLPSGVYLPGQSRWLRAGERLRVPSFAGPVMASQEDGPSPCAVAPRHIHSRRGRAVLVRRSLRCSPEWMDARSVPGEIRALPGPPTQCFGRGGVPQCAGDSVQPESTFVQTTSFRVAPGSRKLAQLAEVHRDDC